VPKKRGGERSKSGEALKSFDWGPFRGGVGAKVGRRRWEQTCERGERRETGGLS